jgi:hypothetical protein
MVRAGKDSCNRVENAISTHHHSTLYLLIAPSNRAAIFFNFLSWQTPLLAPLVACRNGISLTSLHWNFTTIITVSLHWNFSPPPSLEFRRHHRWNFATAIVGISPSPSLPISLTLKKAYSGMCNKNGDPLYCIFCGSSSWEKKSRDRHELAITQGKAPGATQCYNVRHRPIHRYLQCNRCGNVSCSTCLDRIYNHIIEHNLMEEPGTDGWMVSSNCRCHLFCYTAYCTNNYFSTS